MDDVASNDSRTLRSVIQEREGKILETLQRFHNRHSWEPATQVTPLDELLAAEDGELDEWACKRETAVRILDWLAADGPSPVAILRRLYALGDHMMREPYCLLTLRDRAALVGDSHGAHHWIMKRICTDPLLRNGAHSVKAPRQKGLYASQQAARAQKGNSNRSNGHVAVAKKNKSKKSCKP